MQIAADGLASKSMQKHLVAVVYLALETAAVGSIQRIFQQDTVPRTHIARTVHHPVHQNSVVLFDVVLTF